MAPQRSENDPVGLLVVDKPQGISSHGVVSRVRRLLGTRKVGHAGTLDPMATGVLVLGAGRATKLLGYVSGDSKTYQATIRLGIGTVTEDAEGEIEETPGFTLQDDADIDRAIARFVGLIEQVPSAVSAIKVDGRRAYALVRAGEDVQLKPRSVEVFTLERVSGPRELEVGGVPVVDVDVVVDCSSGTYVRALARDIARVLGTAGHLTTLRRTRVGSFVIDRAKTLDQLEQMIEAGEKIPLITLERAVTDQFPLVVVSDAAAAAFANGRPITPNEVLRLDSSNTMSGDKLPVEVEENRGVTHERTFPLPDENLFPPGLGDPVKEDPSRGSGGEDRVVAIAEESNPTNPIALVRFEGGKFRSVLHLRVPN
ncbi:MAG: tRNA pseudouridine(55) synthase TruB [Scrofimicrobium sp.]